MTRPAKLLFACLTTIVAGVLADSAISAESAVTTQQLEKAMASDQLMSAVLTRQADFYTVKIVLDRARFSARESATVAANRERLAANPPPPEVGELDRGQYFIGNTIATLRGLTPWFPCGQMTVGRRLVDVPELARSSGEGRDNRVTVWLLKIDGTQILPAAYSCVADAAMVDVQYRFSIADSERAVAAAVRIDNEYYIERIQQQQQQQPQPQPKSSAE